MLNQEKKYFGGIDGGLDADSADFAVSPNNWVNAENIRTLSTDNGATETVEAVGSTILRSEIEPSVTNIVIGSTPDTLNDRILYFTKSIYSNEDKILCYDISQNVVYRVLLSSQVEGGLNFDKNFPIHSARVINGILYWVNDEINEPRRINVNAGINLNHPGTYPNDDTYIAPLVQSDITVIRNPPAFPVSWSKEEDLSFTQNFIRKEAFQFYYRYTYKTNEVSVLSPFSLTANYNPDDGTALEDANYITITIPFDEVIQQEVLMIDLCARFLNTNTTFIIKTWDKRIAADLQEIEDHNDGIAALSYDFYNNQTLILVDNGAPIFYCDKPFDSVPIYSKTLEISDNRLFLGNNVDGYDTPTETSLSVQLSSISSGGGGSFDVYKADMQFRVGSMYFSYRAYYAHLTSLTPTGYYRLTNYTSTATSTFSYPPFPTLPPVPASITTDEIVFAGTTPSEVQDSIATSNVDYFDFTDTGSNTTLDTSTGISVVQKFSSTKKVGIVFYDKALRRCGVLTNENLVVNIPDRDYSMSTLYLSINWALSNANALNEIPEWAYYYQIVATKYTNILSFVQAVAPDIKYVSKNSSGAFVYNNSLTGSDIYVGVNLDYLIGYGMGYVFSEGDLIKIYQDSGPVYEAEVVGQDGKYLLCTLVDMGALSGEIFIFQIWTPYQYNSNQFYYETSQFFAITDAGMPTRGYSELTGSIEGDVNVRERTHSSIDYKVERMSPNDAVWSKWNTNAGRPNIIDKIGQQQKLTAVKWSNTFIPGTRTNGLSTFDALDQKILPEQLDTLQKLQLTSKVQNEKGIVMLAIGKDETASLYINEVQLYGSAGAADLVQAPNVIGTVNVLKGSFGTRNPESVIEFRGNVFWIDVFNGKIIQYSANGLFPISNYKMTRYWKQFCDQYNSMTASEIEALGSRPFVYMAVDPHHWELLVTVPKLLSTPPKGYLPDYPSMVYPFDIWDGQAKTLVYKLNVEPNRWNGSYQMTPEGMIAMQNKLFSFKNGQLYENNSEESFCEFYGVQYKPRIMFVCNQEKAIPKTYNNISINGSQPSFVYFRSEIPYVQASDLENISFSNLEGNYYAVILRNKIIPTSTGFVTTGLLTGEKLKTTVLRVMIEWVVSTNQINLNFVSIGYQLSAGHINFKRQ